MTKWKQQWNRILRYEERLEQLQAQIPFDRPAAYFCDDVLTFFIECHSLKDWMTWDDNCRLQDANDPRKTLKRADKRRELRRFVNSTHELQICADLANAKKHLKLEPNPITGRRFSSEAESLLSLTLSVVLHTDEGEFEYGCVPNRIAEDHQIFAEAVRRTPPGEEIKVDYRRSERIAAEDWEAAASLADKRKNALVKKGFGEENIRLILLADVYQNDRMLDLDRGIATLASNCTMRWIEFFKRRVLNWNKNS